MTTEEIIQWAQEHSKVSPESEQALKDGIWWIILYGEEMLHIDDKGEVRHIPIGSKEYWDIKEKQQKDGTNKHE